MKRILIVYSGGHHRGGIETYLGNLFGLYDREKMQLLLVSLGEWDLTRQLTEGGLGAEVRVLSGKRLRLSTVRDLRRVVREEQAGLIVSQGVVSNAYARLTSLTTGVPNLTVVHSDLRLDYANGAKRLLYALSDRVLRRATARYIAVSEYLKAIVVSSGVRPGDVQVVYNGVSAGEPRQTNGTRFPSRSGEQISLVSVGRLHSVKNYDGLIRTVALLPEGVGLTIWGEGSEREHLGGLAASLGLGDRVRLPGESADMAEALEGADIYVQPSKSEGCSFAVAEAMLQGLPTVVTPRGGLPEQVEQGVTGLVSADLSPVSLASAIRTLVEDRDLAQRLGRAGQEAATKMYSMDKWIDKTTAALCAAAEEGTCAR